MDGISMTSSPSWKAVRITSEEANVLVVDIDVDESAQLSAFIL